MSYLRIILAIIQTQINDILSKSALRSMPFLTFDTYLIDLEHPSPSPSLRLLALIITQKVGSFSKDGFWKIIL